MDSLLSIPLLLFSLFLCLLTCLLVNLKTKHSKASLRLPPGPRPLPLIGNIHNIIRSLPHHAMRDLSRQYGPLMLLHIGQIPTVVVSSPDAAREIMETHDINFASRPMSTIMGILTCNGKGIGITPYGEYWQQVRKICIQELLSMKRVQSYRSIREEEVDNLISFIFSCASRSQPIDLSKRFTSLISGIITRATIGSNCTNQDEYFEALDMAVRLAAGFDVADLFPSSRIARFVSRATKKAEKFQEVLSRYLDEIIEEHKQRKMFQGESEVEDLLGILLKLHEEDTLVTNHLDMETVKGVIRDLFGAGIETSSTTLEWIMLELLRNPLAMKKAQSEVRELLKGKTHVSESDIQNLNYLHLVIKETLRLHPPVPLLLPRQCRETCRIFDHDIAEGMTVLVNVWAIGQDPKYWEDPEEFKPERFMTNNIDFQGTNFEFLPFGSGRRICVGLSFGLANIELPLASLLCHFDWKLADGLNPEKVDMSESFGITCRPKSPLRLYAVPYKTDLEKQL